MEFDKKVLDHTLHDWIDKIRHAVHTITPGMYIIAGVDRHRQPILDATLSVLEAAGPVDPSVIPRAPSVIRLKPFQDFYTFGQMRSREEMEEAFHLARFRPVIAEMHTPGLRNTFRRLEDLEVPDWDLGLIRGVYCMTGLPHETGEVFLKDIRFFDSEETVMKEKADEFKYSTERYFVGDALRQMPGTGITIDDIKKRFDHGYMVVVDRVQSLCAA